MNQGITFKHDCDIVNSVFIGESGNLGEPNEVRLKNGTKVMWHRSTPQENGGGRGGFIGKYDNVKPFLEIPSCNVSFQSSVFYKALFSLL